MPTPSSVYGSGVADYQQAEWLAAVLGSQWKYDHSESQWHHWDKMRWAVDKTDLVRHTVSQAAAKALLAGTTDKAQRDAWTKLLSVGPVDRALEALASMPEYAMAGDEWDADPMLLGVKNGVVDLRTNRLIEPDPDQLITLSTGVSFEPITDPASFYERAPQFIDFLAGGLVEGIPGATDDYDGTEDPAMVAFLLRWFGAGLFGIHPEQRFLLMTGSGRNGKGVLKHAILSAVGEYGVQPDANLYSRSRMGPARSNEARADLMALFRKRIAFFSEPDKGQFNEEMLKAHTGGDLITARGLYQKVPKSWEPTHSITFLVNDAPSIEDVGPSMGSRVLVADFRHRYEGTAEDKRLYDKVKAEAEGVLAILCWAASRWFASWSSGQGGLIIPERVAGQSKAFMERNDPVAECLRERFEVHPDVRCAGQVAYDAYREWHEAAGRQDDPMSMVKFTATLEKKGFQRYRMNTSRGWIGLKPLGAMQMADRDDE